MRRFYVGILLICLAPLTPADARQQSNPAPRATIPFRTAVVESADNRSFTIAWHADGVKNVEVFAGTNPVKIGRDRRVGSGAGAGDIQVRELPPATRWYFELVPDVGTPLVVADRSLHLSTAANFRDAGGYRTDDGKWVRMGLVYRSNQLNNLTLTEMAQLQGLGLKLIWNLRTDEERRRGADRKLRGTDEVAADVLADDAVKIHAWMSGSSPAHSEGHPTTHRSVMVQAIYRDFVRLPSAQRSYHLLFERLAERDDLPTVFHCSAGKDRTGWADAVLLTILGVPRATIVHDYELTDVYLKGVALANLRRTFGSSQVSNSRSVAADPTDLNAAFDEVRTRFGSFERYLRIGLGIDAATLKAIRANFLVG